MGATRLTAAVSLVLALAACNQSGSDNVMTPTANALTAAQVDLALGPELANTAGNQLDTPNGVNAIDSAKAVEAADTKDALDESVPDQAADEPSSANNVSEQ